MIEFEKWFNKKFPEKSMRGAVQYEYCGEAWQAALEWIYFDVCPEAWDVGDVEFDIDQELKQLNQSNSQSDNSSQSDTPSH